MADHSSKDSGRFLSKETQSFSQHGVPVVTVNGVTHERDPRHRAVDTYTESHLLAPAHNPFHSALQHAYHNSLANGLSDISCSASQAKFLALQVRIARARNVLEIGTLGGYSAIWLASAHPDVKVTTIEIEPKNKALAEEHFHNAGVADRVSVHLGAALVVLRQLQDEIKAENRQPFDFVFIDADKENMLNYVKLVLQITTPQTPIFVDNVVRRGLVADEMVAQKDSRVRGARDLIEGIGEMEEIDAVVVQTVGEKNYDGFLLALRK